MVLVDELLFEHETIDFVSSLAKCFREFEIGRKTFAAIELEELLGMIEELCFGRSNLGITCFDLDEFINGVGKKKPIETVISDFLIARYEVIAGHV